jgi:hypothetical protein
MTKLKPKLLIQYSDIYDRTLHELRGEKYNESMFEIGDKYKKRFKDSWENMESKIFDTISRVSGLKWQKPFIDCYLVKRCRPFSMPLTLSIYGKDGDEIGFEKQVETAIHELIHNIVVQNSEIINKVDWSKKYPGISRKTRIHVGINAIMKLVMLDLFKKKKTREHITLNSRLPDYKEAWEIVEKEGAVKIIRKMH